MLTISNTTKQRHQRRILVVVCVVLALLQFLDLHSSLRAAAAGRSETNPLILWVIGYVGFTSAVVLFKCVALGLILVSYRVCLTLPHLSMPLTLLVSLCGVQSVVVLNNYS